MKAQISTYSFMILLLAAHFSRAEQNILAILTLFVPLLFLIKKPWVINLLQAIAYLAAPIWLYGAYQYIQIRSADGESWIRLLIIMGVVALYSAWTGYYLKSQCVKETYGIVE